MSRSALAAFEAALATYTSERDVGRALHELAAALVGVKLFTLTADNPEGGYVRRVYSSDEVAYPLLGTKPIVFDAAYEASRTERGVYSANSVAEMERDFPDLGLITALGCGSAINIPIVVGGTLLGSVNLLDAEGAYPAEKVEAAKALVVPAMACFLILRTAFTI